MFQDIRKEKRGFFTLAVVIAFFCIFCIMIAKIHEENSEERKALNHVLFLEKQYYFDRNFRNSVIQALSVNENETREENVILISERMKKLEEKLELNSEYEVDMFCGYVDENERKRMLVEMMDNDTLLSCKKCWNFSQTYFDASSNKTFSKCAFILEVDLRNKVAKISNSDWSFIGDPETNPMNPGNSGREVYIGLSIHEKGFSNVNLQNN